jgi:hypothetical protein
MDVHCNYRDAMQHAHGRAGPGRAEQNTWDRRSMCVLATNKAKAVEMFWDNAYTVQAISDIHG